MTGPGNDIVSVTNLTASGANIIFLPPDGEHRSVHRFLQLKSHQTLTLQKKSSWIDLDAGKLIEKPDFDNMTEEIFKLLIDTASGKKTKNELNDYREISIFKDGVIM